MDKYLFENLLVLIDKIFGFLELSRVRKRKKHIHQGLSVTLEVKILIFAESRRTCLHCLFEISAPNLLKVSTILNSLKSKGRFIFLGDILSKKICVQLKANAYHTTYNMCLYFRGQTDFLFEVCFQDMGLKVHKSYKWSLIPDL